MTGAPKKRVVMLKNYRKIQIDSELTKDSKEIVVTPLSDFTLNAEDDFYILIPAVRGRHSIYLENPDRITKFPWLEVRSFEQKPSLSFELSNSPDKVQSDFVKYYNKKYKKQINQNLSKFTVVFDQRDDEEALEILQFLETHLGYKKFRFSMPRPYLTDESHETTLSKPRMSIFFCPSWDHEVVYKNNHKITATFIESATSKEEDLFSVFGIGQNESRPCYSAYLEDPITPHQLCTFSSVLQAATCGGFKRLQGGEVGLDLKRKAVDLIFIIDTTGSMTYQTLSGSGPNGNFQYQKFRAAIDTIRKMIVAHDDYVMPGTLDYGGQLDTPAIHFENISGGDNLPPWAIDENENSLIDAAVDDINKDLKLKGFNLDNFERFKIKIDKQRVNIGLVLFEAGTQLDVSTGQESFDKKYIYDKLSGLPGSYSRTEGEYYTKAIAKALAQMYNSPRAEYVTDRMIIMLSDGMIFPARVGNDGAGNPPGLYSPTALGICQELRYDRSLAKRRPKDEILEQFGHGGNTIKKFLDEYRHQESDKGKSFYNNPDNGVDNPDWYEERLNTIFISVGIGFPGGLSTRLKDYVYDFEDETKGEGFYFEISSSSNQGGEVKRLLDLIKAVEVITEGSGYENYFSVTVHNCGPRDVEIKNTLINIESEAEPLKWTTERLKAGIPKGGSFQNLQYIGENETEGNSLVGTGGQYYGDPNNKKVLTDETSAESNILWESFNTKYEIYRECGPPHLINGGWKNKPSDGVNNVGVASKGMPVRVFTSSTDLQIVDYNIGNVSEENNFQGDYSHLPKLKAGESLDLFFGIRINRLASINENIQLVFNTDDGSIKKSDCYAEIKFPIRLGDVTEPEPIEVIEKPPEPETCTGISDYLPIDSEGRICALQVFTWDWLGSGRVFTSWIGGPNGEEASLPVIPDDVGTFGAGIPFGINDTRFDQSEYPPIIKYQLGGMIVKSSYVVLPDGSHSLPTPYVQESVPSHPGYMGIPNTVDITKDGKFGAQFFGSWLVPPGWEMVVFTGPNYSAGEGRVEEPGSGYFQKECGFEDDFRVRFSLKGPFWFVNHVRGVDGVRHEPMLPVSQSILDLFAAETCPGWSQMASLRNIPVVNGFEGWGLTDYWYNNNAFHRYGLGGYSYLLRKTDLS